MTPESYFTGFLHFGQRGEPKTGYSTCFEHTQISQLLQRFIAETSASLPQIAHFTRGISSLPLSLKFYRLISPLQQRQLRYRHGTHLNHRNDCNPKMALSDLRGRLCQCHCSACIHRCHGSWRISSLLPFLPSPPMPFR